MTVRQLRLYEALRNASEDSVRKHGEMRGVNINGTKQDIIRRILQVYI